MTDPVWPNTLPNPLREGYSAADQPALVRTEMESGPAQVVRIATDFITNFAVQFVLDSTQLKTLRSFWFYSAGAGADWFEMPLSSNGEIELHRVRFTSPPGQNEIRNNLFRVSFSVESEGVVPVYE